MKKFTSFDFITEAIERLEEFDIKDIVKHILIENSETIYADHPHIGYLTIHTDDEGAYNDLMQGGAATLEEARQKSFLSSKNIINPKKIKKPKNKPLKNKPLSASKGYLGIGADAKTIKGQKEGWLTAINYMIPAGKYGTANLCSHASDGCSANCLVGTGRGAYKNTILSRLRKTKTFTNDRRQFLSNLYSDIKASIKFSNKHNLPLAVRLNGTSDIGWQGQRIHSDDILKSQAGKLRTLLGGKRTSDPKYVRKSGGRSLMDHFSNEMSGGRRVEFYDYTKNPHTAIAHREGRLPSNYDITFSATEEPHSIDFAVDHALKGGRSTVVFNVPTGTKTKPAGELPKFYKGLLVVDGDESDLRFLDKHPVTGERGGFIVGLRYKKIKEKEQKVGASEKSDFVVQPSDFLDQVKHSMPITPQEKINYELGAHRHLEYTAEKLRKAKRSEDQFRSGVARLRGQQKP